MRDLRRVMEVEEEVRRVAGKIDRCRTVLRSPLTAAAFGVQVLPGSLGCLEALVALVTILAALSLLGIPYLLALPLIALYRHHYQRRLRFLLAALPEMERAVVLHDLAHESVEARAIVAPALRRLSLPGEVTPSAPSGGCGNELGSG